MRSFPYLSMRKGSQYAGNRKRLVRFMTDTTGRSCYKVRRRRLMRAANAERIAERTGEPARRRTTEIIRRVFWERSRSVVMNNAIDRISNDDVLREVATLARARPTSILIVGTLTSPQRAAVINVIASERAVDVFYAQDHAQLAFPDQPGVLVVLDNLHALSQYDQFRLLHWINDTHPQILSFAMDHPYPLVTAGRFIDALFYRLNVVSFIVQGT